MHEAISGLQVGLTVASTVGVGGALYAAGNLLGRRGGGSTGRGPVHGALSSIDGTDAGVRAEPQPITAYHSPTESITDNAEEHRFEIRVDGELAGFSEYERRDAVVAFNHTQIDAGFRGRGLAGRLVTAALDATREARLSVRPNCPFVRAFMEEHNEYEDLIDSPAQFHGSNPRTRR
jgi:hypothetical protein